MNSAKVKISGRQPPGMSVNYRYVISYEGDRPHTTFSMAVDLSELEKELADHFSENSVGKVTLTGKQSDLARYDFPVKREFLGRLAKSDQLKSFNVTVDPWLGYQDLLKQGN